MEFEKKVVTAKKAPYLLQRPVDAPTGHATRRWESADDRNRQMIELVVKISNMFNISWRSAATQ